MARLPVKHPYRGGAGDLYSQERKAQPARAERATDKVTQRASEGGQGGGERRVNLVLRALVDEMLLKLRELNRNSAAWTDQELARAEAELEALMARVRKVALNTDK